jgi:metal-responsive CopG/Arc/MetJ family transcriptional regulator
MTNVMTIRLPGSLLAGVDRKAAALGRSRTEHVRQLLEADVAKVEGKRKRFASLHLKGIYAIGRGSDNAAVRRAMAKRAHEKNS